MDTGTVVVAVAMVFQVLIAGYLAWLTKQLSDLREADYRLHTRINDALKKHSDDLQEHERDNRTFREQTKADLEVLKSHHTNGHEGKGG